MGDLEGGGHIHQEVGQMGLMLEVFPHLFSIYTQPDGKQTVEIEQGGFGSWGNAQARVSVW